MVLMKNETLNITCLKHLYKHITMSLLIRTFLETAIMLKFNCTCNGKSFYDAANDWWLEDESVTISDEYASWVHSSNCTMRRSRHR